MDNNEVKVQEPTQGTIPEASGQAAAPKPENKNMKKCMACGADIAKKAKACPNCGAKNKKPIYKRVWFIVIIAIIFIAIISSVAGGSSDSNDKKISDSKPDTSPSTTIENQVLYEAEGVKITAVGYAKGLFGDVIKVLIENDSNIDVTVGLDTLIVNDYMIYDLFSETVAAGKKVNTNIELYSSELKEAGISNVGKIELKFYLYDDASWDEICSSDLIEIKTSDFDKMDTVVEISGKELYNKDGIKVVGKAVDDDDFWGAAVILYIENNTNKDIVVQSDDVSVNGFMVSDFMSSTVFSGKKAIDDLTIFESTLEENNIEKIEDIEFKFVIIDNDKFTNIYESNVISISVE